MLYLVRNVKLLLIIFLPSCVSKKNIQTLQIIDSNESYTSKEFILNHSIQDGNIEYIDPLLICLYIFIGVIMINLILFIFNKR